MTIGGSVVSPIGKKTRSVVVASSVAGSKKDARDTHAESVAAQANNQGHANLIRGQRESLLTSGPRRSSCARSLLGHRDPHAMPRLDQVLVTIGAHVDADPADAAGKGIPLWEIIPRDRGPGIAPDVGGFIK